MFNIDVCSFQVPNSGPIFRQLFEWLLYSKCGPKCVCRIERNGFIDMQFLFMHSGDMPLSLFQTMVLSRDV